MVDEYKQQINQVWRSYIINTEETAKLLFVIRKPIRYQRAKGACHIASKRNDGGTLQASHFHTGRAESGGKDNYYPRMGEKTLPSEQPENFPVCHARADVVCD